MTPAEAAERERLVKALQDARNAFNNAKETHEYHRRQAEYVRDEMELTRILGVVRAEALAAFDAAHKEER